MGAEAIVELILRYGCLEPSRDSEAVANVVCLEPRLLPVLEEPGVSRGEAFALELSMLGVWVLGCETTEGGLIRQLRSKAEPTLYSYPCTVFSRAIPTSRDCTQLNCCWPANDCIVYYRTGGVMGDNLYCPLGWLCTQKSSAVGSYRTYNIIIFLWINLPV